MMHEEKDGDASIDDRTEGKEEEECDERSNINDLMDRLTYTTIWRDRQSMMKRKKSRKSASNWEMNRSKVTEVNDSTQHRLSPVADVSLVTHLCHLLSICIFYFPIDLDDEIRFFI